MMRIMMKKKMTNNKKKNKNLKLIMTMLKWTNYLILDFISDIKNPQVYFQYDSNLINWTLNVSYSKYILPVDYLIYRGPILMNTIKEINFFYLSLWILKKYFYFHVFLKSFSTLVL